MIDLLAVYECPKCGDVLEDQISKTDYVDIENDEVYPVAYCLKCGREVSQKTVEDASGNISPVFDHVDHERWLWSSGYFDDQEPQP